MPPPPAETTTLTHFHSIPWTSALLSSPFYTQTPSVSRLTKFDTTDSFISQTLSTPTTIPHLLTLRLQPSSAWPTPSAPGTKPPNPPYIQLLTLSPAGLCGFAETLHGGAIATILDECLSCLVTLHLEDENNRNPDTGEGSGPILTASLEIRYKRPVTLPGTYAARAWVVTMSEEDGERGESQRGKGDGNRKRARLRVDGDLVDGEGKVYSEARGLWVESRGVPKAMM